MASSAGEYALRPRLLIPLRVEERLAVERDECPSASSDTRRRRRDCSAVPTCRATGVRIDQRPRGGRRRARRFAGHRRRATVSTSALWPRMPSLPGVASIGGDARFRRLAERRGLRDSCSRRRAGAARSSVSRFTRSTSSVVCGFSARGIAGASSPALAAHVDQPGIDGHALARDRDRAGRHRDVGADRGDRRHRRTRWWRYRSAPTTPARCAHR